MPKNKQRTRYKYFRQINTLSYFTAAGNNGINTVLLDAKALLEAIASQGEEVKISKATLRTEHVLDTTNTNDAQMFLTIAAMVSDQPIAIAAPTVSNAVLDDELDVLTAGDYEEQDLGTYVSKALPVGTGVSFHTLKTTTDITSFLQRCSGLMARSAILATNPYMSIVGVGGLSINNRPPRLGIAVLDLKYVNIQKPLRMLA